MAEKKLSWDEYRAQFPQPYDLSVYVGKPLSQYPANYDEMRKANMKWHAEYIRNHAPYIGPELMLNPFVRGGWYYGMNGAQEYIPDPDAAPPVDWAAEAAAGRPVIGPAVAAAAPVSPVPEKAVEAAVSVVGAPPRYEEMRAAQASRRSLWKRMLDKLRGNR